ncbi:hypothetical protein PHYSODRAFT_321743 [Phytophthora sojae]|uniref:Uncharacterized protein n=1 Tax=Phytophthora sojae (strain P6497) TaxID=1094619 RepID=G4YFZ6_PHYSP|nr:hypothetical protein PHYSODRAFT_321743 [Phytophthora sojae]EGZ28044.1 hypothetical protein PHYSODRAFT_321743 [Phytophthora sojae]|eukprot:XP_009515319.1 hypothetical protein PHYSODRAFT_321743 [Phytophthora sojae]
MPREPRRRFHNDDEDSEAHMDALARCLKGRERARVRLIARLRRLDEEIEAMEQSMHRLARYGIERDPAPTPPPQQQSPERRSPRTPEFVETYGDRDDDLFDSD